MKVILVQVLLLQKSITIIHSKGGLIIKFAGYTAEEITAAVNGKLKLQTKTADATNLVDVTLNLTKLTPESYEIQQSQINTIIGDSTNILSLSIKDTEANLTSADLAYEKVQFLSADTYFYGTKAGTGFPLEGKYVSPDKIVIGTFDGENSSSFTKTGTTWYASGQTYQGEYKAGVPHNKGLYYSDGWLVSGAAHNESKTSSSGMKDHKSIELSYMKDVGLVITFSQDADSDPGLYVKYDQILVMGSKHGIDTKITINKNDFQVLPAESLGINTTSSGYNKASLYIPNSKLTDLNKYSKIKVFFDTGEDGEGIHQMLKANL